jgi:hypothetical protein
MSTVTPTTALSRTVLPQLTATTIPTTTPTTTPKTAPVNILSPTPSPSSSLSSGAKAGIGIAVAVVALIALAGFLYFWLQRRKVKVPAATDDQPVYFNDTKFKHGPKLENTSIGVVESYPPAPPVPSNPSELSGVMSPVELPESYHTPGAFHESRA